MEHIISLPYGAPGEVFKLSELISHIKESYRDYIIQ